MILEEYVGRSYFAIPVCGLFLFLGLIHFSRYRFNQRKYKAIISNLRFVRAGMFILTVLSGAIASFSFNRPVSLYKIFLAMISVFFAWEFSVVVNDIYDREVDQVCNKSRPLAQGVLSVREYQWISFVFVSLSLSFALVINFPVFLVSIAWIFLGILYSVPPFRMRENFLGNIIIGLALVISFMMGILLSGSLGDLLNRKNLVFYTILLVFGALITLTKDLKDIRGDNKHGIKNIYSVYGREKGKKIVLVLLFVSLVFPLMLIHKIFLSVIIVMFALASCCLYYMRENEKEIYLMGAIEGMYLFMCVYFWGGIFL